MEQSDAGIRLEAAEYFTKCLAHIDEDIDRAVSLGDDEMLRVAMERKRYLTVAIAALREKIT